jgi:MoaA/NifB/PqqE/SkfB family radical SAM enzyme
MAVASPSGSYDGNAPLRELIAVLFLQPQCNMTCSFCVTEDGFSPMTMAQAVELLESLRGAGVGNVILGGGEPFYWRPGAMELAAKAKAMGMFVQVGTNGLDLPEVFAEAAQIDRYIIPLESVDASVHDSLRHHRGGHHTVVMDRLDALGRAGKSTTVSTVITRRNTPSLAELRRFLSGYQARFGNLHAWHLYRMLPMGRGGAVNGPRLDAGREEYDRACAEMRAQATGFRIIKRPDMLNSESVGFFWIEDGRVRCHARNPGEFGPASQGIIIRTV